MIYEELLKHINDSIVVLPNTRGIVHSGLFSVVDNHFGELCKYM